jgi:hypothetical protein
VLSSKLLETLLEEIMPIRKLEGTLLFVQVQNPVDCFEKTKGKEWKASIAVDEDTADAWNEDYPKQPATAVKTSEFEAKYKTPAPNPSAKKQYVITLRKNTKLGNGEDVPDIYQPKILVPEDGEHKDVTSTVLVGNGSKGAMSVDVWEMAKGNVARLKNILITDLVEYVKTEGSGSKYNPGEEFGSAAPAAKTEAKAKPKAKAKVQLDEEEDVPF